MSTVFDGEKMEIIKNMLKKGGKCIIKLLMFYEDRKSIFFNVLVSDIYDIIGKYL